MGVELERPTVVHVVQVVHVILRVHVLGRPFARRSQSDLASYEDSAALLG